MTGGLVALGRDAGDPGCVPHRARSASRSLFPTTMHPRLAELSEHLALQRRTLLDLAAGVPNEGWQTRPAEGRWSVSEIFEHLHRVERGVAAVVAKRVAKARAEGHPAETETS